MDFSERITDRTSINNELVIASHVNFNSLPSNTELSTLIKVLRPQWSHLNMTLKHFSNGITNNTYGLFQTDFHTNEIINESEGLLIKIYGMNTELFIDRQNELTLMQELAKYNFSNHVLLVFSNGFVCSYIPGEPCDSKQISSNHISHLIAKKLASYHSIPLNNDKVESSLFPQIKKLFHAIKSNDELYEKLSLDIDHIEHFVLPEFKLDVVLCHNDLLGANIIYNSETDDVSFIDFEFCAYNYWLYDIANHFVEYTDYIEHSDADFYPSREYQKQWLNIYLSYCTRTISDPTLNLDKLCDMISKLTALSHLFWSLWLFSQSGLAINQHFDHQKCGQSRFQKYLKFRKFFYE